MILVSGEFTDFRPNPLERGIQLAYRHPAWTAVGSCYSGSIPWDSAEALADRVESDVCSCKFRAAAGDG